MPVIQNEQLKIVIDEKGAELKTVLHKQLNLDYMWSGDPAFWGKTSPVLFPVVGALKENRFFYEGKAYHLPRHGFAREKIFTATEQAEDAVSFRLESDESTLAVYPFDFVFTIRYRLAGDELSVLYDVQNKGGGPMYFSVGGHPAFRVPLIEGTAYTDYLLRFEKEETAGRWPVTREGLIGSDPLPLLQNSRDLPLSKDLFQSDAVVLKGLRSSYVELLSPKTPHGLRFSLTGFPFLGLWAAPGADFVCIEPWCGIADSVNTDQQLPNKEGILRLPAGDSFAVMWTVRFF